MNHGTNFTMENGCCVRADRFASAVVNGSMQLNKFACFVHGVRTVPMVKNKVLWHIFSLNIVKLFF